jgi:CheY-like chemotaxis protein
VSLLLVEDNLNNQQVARELLEEEGATVCIANHGGEAVRMLGGGQPHFDAVLMDMQMPVMDGLAATRHIRGELGLRELPIIAMTANAMAADREASLEAGMNDHVGKPFDLDQLVATLLRHTGRQAAGSSASPAPVAVPGDALPPALQSAARTAGVDLPLALQRIGGKSEVYERLLSCFVRDIEHLPQQLRAHLANGDAEATGRVLHDVKGLAGTLAIPALAATAAQAEQIYLAGETRADQASALIDALCSTVTAIRPSLVELLAALQPAGHLQEVALEAAGAMNPQILRAALGPLAALLRDCDMAATDAMSALRRDLHGHLRESLQPMDDAISELDFDRALHLCEELMETTQP